MLFIFASAGSIVETAYQFSQSDDKNGTNAVSCVPLHTPGSDSRTRLASKLPVVLSADEVVRFLEAIPSLKSRTALTTVYAAGLRVSEVVLLKIADNDSQRMVIRVEQGKGGKDRYVMLSPQPAARHIDASLAIVGAQRWPEAGPRKYGNVPWTPSRQAD